MSVLSLLITPALLFMSCRDSHNESRKMAMYNDIDREIENSNIYQQEKEHRIKELKERLKKETSPELKRNVTDWLIREYDSYISDSALHYINMNLLNPEVLEDKRLENGLLIKKADVAAHAGLFRESMEILKSINKSELDSTLLEAFYSAYSGLYQYQSEYANDTEYAEEHARLRDLYIDSISMVAPHSSFNYVINKASSAARHKDFPQAEELILSQIEKYQSGERNYSILASIMADIYKQKGDKDNYTKYLGKSVISDIQGVIKENMAIRALATVCYEEGDLERADKYLRQSFADANFYAARMRNAQSSRMLPIIGEAYIQQQKELHHSLSLFIIFISILAFGFIIIAVFAFMQVKKVRINNKRTKEMLDEVSNLSKKLTDVNKELSQANEELQTSNKIQGEYGALFMEYASLAISSLQKYQQGLKVAAAQGNMTQLIKKIESASVENKTLAEFYSKFDEAILNIYPHFVEKFNALLKPDEQIELNSKETLNTELRVFALIRIGINDSEKIAKFLRCSISTVYTYRSKMKKRALSPDTFEEDLTNI